MENSSSKQSQQIKVAQNLRIALQNGLNNLFIKTDAASLGAFRIFFGLIMLVEVFRYFDRGWIATYWIRPKWNFAYWPFDFQPLPGDGMYYLFVIFGILSVLIMIGLFYRASIILFFIGFTYMFLLEQTRYLNHFYLISLLSFVLIFVPANRSFSLDNKLFKFSDRNTQPLWSLWLMRFMIAIPYFFGGVAKINYDWLHGQPLKRWLSDETDFFLLGRFFEEDWMILFLSYSGLLLDLLIVPFLIFKRTRVWAFLLITLFHLMNARMFVIGIFPWFMILATTIYFQPSWPRYLIAAFGQKQLYIPDLTNQTMNLNLSPKQKLAKTLLLGWFAIMVLLPFRHWVYSGNVNWTEKGHKYSWHMKLRTKSARGNFIVKDKNSDFEERINPRKHLPGWQRRKVLARPTLVWLFAQKLKEEYAKEGRDVEVYADIRARLNGRKYQQFIDANIDLTETEYPFWSNPDWVVPLTTPLED